MSELTVKNCQEIIDQWIQQYGVRYFSNLTNLAILMEEVGEVARILARQHGDQSCKPNETHNDLADELADVFFVLVCLANQNQVDLTDAIGRNLAKKTRRDRDRHHRNPKLKPNRSGLKNNQ